MALPNDVVGIVGQFAMEAQINVVVYNDMGTTYQQEWHAYRTSSGRIEAKKVISTAMQPLHIRTPAAMNMFAWGVAPSRIAVDTYILVAYRGTTPPPIEFEDRATLLGHFKHSMMDYDVVYEEECEGEEVSFRYLMGTYAWHILN
jgi:hypothetical protein